MSDSEDPEETPPSEARFPGRAPSDDAGTSSLPAVSAPADAAFITEILRLADESPNAAMFLAALVHERADRVQRPTAPDGVFPWLVDKWGYRRVVMFVWGTMLLLTALVLAVGWVTAELDASVVRGVSTAAAVAAASLGLGSRLRSSEKKRPDDSSP